MTPQHQEELFLTGDLASPPVAIPGFCLRENYITADQEKELIQRIETGPWQSDYRRRIQQYGLGYAGERGGTPTWVRDFPDWLLPLAERVASDGPMERFPENCVINEYIPPLGIAPHKDYPAFGPTVACVSLGSDVVLDFVDAEGAGRIPVHVPARSF